MRMIVASKVMGRVLVKTIIAGYRPYGKNKLKPYEENEKKPQPSPKKMKSMAIYQDQS